MDGLFSKEECNGEKYPKYDGLAFSSTQMDNTGAFSMNHNSSNNNNNFVLAKCINCDGTNNLMSSWHKESGNCWILVMLVPPDTSCDHLRDYLEVTADVCVSKVIKLEASLAVVSLERPTSYPLLDVNSLKKLCDKDLDDNRKLLFAEFSNQQFDATCHTLLITGICEKIIDTQLCDLFKKNCDSIQNFCRIGQNLAIIEFDNQKDAECVQRNGELVLGDHHVTTYFLRHPSHDAFTVGGCGRNILDKDFNDTQNCNLRNNVRTAATLSHRLQPFAVEPCIKQGSIDNVDARPECMRDCLQFDQSNSRLELHTMVPTSPYNNSIDDVEQLCSCSQYYDMINDNIMPSMFENSRHPLIVLGIPSTTSSDNLRDYLEVTMEINIVSIFKLGETSAVVLVESAACSMIDITKLKQLCDNDPLDGSIRLSFLSFSYQRLHVNDSRLLVTNICQETDVDLLKNYFMNKRSGGGKIKQHSRLADTIASVEFEMPENAESVQKKCHHFLDGHHLKIFYLHNSALDMCVIGKGCASGLDPNCSHFVNSSLASSERSACELGYRHNHESSDMSKPNLFDYDEYSFNMQKLTLPLPQRQFNVCCISDVIEHLCSKFPSARIMVDRTVKQLEIVAPKMHFEAFHHVVMTFCMDIVESSLPLTAAKLCMFKKPDCIVWMKQLLLKSNSQLCYWEICGNKLDITGTRRNTELLVKCIDNAFVEKRISLSEDERMVITLSNCDSISNDIHESRKDTPGPVLWNDAESLVVVDTADRYNETEAYIKSLLLRETKVQRSFPANSHHVKFLKMCCEELLKGLCRRSEEYGITVSLKSGGLHAVGRCERLQDISLEIDTLLKGIRCAKMSIIDSRFVNFLHSLKGREFLKTLGENNNCFLTINEVVNEHDREQPHADRCSTGESMKPSNEMLNSASDLSATINDFVGGDEKNMDKSSTFKVTIEVIFGEIAKCQADVIICPIHPSLDMSRGTISASLVKEGGQRIQDELLQHRQHHDTDVRKIVSTSGGNLCDSKCKAVFHFSLPRWKDDHGQIMEHMVYMCLKKADRFTYKTVAFPSLGTGKLGYPYSHSARIMYSCINGYFSHNPNTNIEKVKIVVYRKDHECMQVFSDVVNGKGAQKTSPLSRTSHREFSNDDRDLEYKKARFAPFTKGRPSKRGVTVHVGNVVVTIEQGDILSKRCDAVVIATTKDLDLSKGVLSKKISKLCGPTLQNIHEDRRIQVREHGLTITPVVRSRNIGFANVVWVHPNHFKNDWVEAISSALIAADMTGFHSVSMPALGTGGRHSDEMQFSGSMHEAVKLFSNNHPQNLKQLDVVIFKTEMLYAYVSAFDKKTSFSFDQAVSSHRGTFVHAKTSDTSKDINAISVYIYSYDVPTIANVKAEISKGLDELADVTATEKLINLANLSSKQVSDIRQLGRQHSVNVSLNQESCVVLFTGNELSVAKAVAEFKDIKISMIEEQSSVVGLDHIHWQYESSEGSFQDFNHLHAKEIEHAYKKRHREVFIERKNGVKYKIVFKQWKEYCVTGKNIGQSVAVRRRDTVNETSQIALPKMWAKMDEGQMFIKVDISSGCQEYKKVAENFKQNIVKLERIQHPSLYQQYKIKRLELQKQNNGASNEKRLFHGTSSDTIDFILQNGFNRSFCGKNGTALGSGVYFAVDANYSMGYSSGRQMFQVRVLVGETVLGNSSLRTAPVKSGTNRPYDSVTNSTNSPSMYVIFHDAQAYPEYLISF